VSQLRKKLESLYGEEPGECGFRIDIPKGGYVPTFPRTEQVPAAEPAHVEPPPARRLSFWWPFLAGVVLAGAGILTFQSIPRGGQKGQSSVPALWAPLIEAPAPTIVSFGVPLFYSGSGLYVRDVLVNEPGQELDSGVEKVGKAIKQMLRPAEDVYTGIGESVGTYGVGRFLERRGVNVQIANSHYLGPSDLRGKNLVIISSSRFQTPLNQFKLPTAFDFAPQGVIGSYLNVHPLPGEPAAYEAKGGGAGNVSISYATICVWPGVSAQHRLIYISGINSWCTLAAARYALDPKSQSDLERRFGEDPLQGPRGRKGKYFQVLIRVEGKYDQVRSFEYVAHRYLDAQPIRAD
jgi:hypothetical protein